MEKKEFREDVVDREEMEKKWGRDDKASSVCYVNASILAATILRRYFCSKKKENWSMDKENTQTLSMSYHN